ncbi:hypothetical protein ACA910_009524 [Epithemia clementina (nom. ined.)]
MTTTATQSLFQEANPTITTTTANPDGDKEEQDANEYNPSVLFVEQEKALEQVLSLMKQSPISSSSPSLQLEEDDDDEDVPNPYDNTDDDQHEQYRDDSEGSMLQEQKRMEQYCEQLQQQLLDSMASVRKSPTPVKQNRCTSQTHDLTDNDDGEGEELLDDNFPDTLPLTTTDSKGRPLSLSPMGSPNNPIALVEPASLFSSPFNANIPIVVDDDEDGEDNDNNYSTIEILEDTKPLPESEPEPVESFVQEEDEEIEEETAPTEAAPFVPVVEETAAPLTTVAEASFLVEEQAVEETANLPAVSDHNETAEQAPLILEEPDQTAEQAPLASEEPDQTAEQAPLASEEPDDQAEELFFDSVGSFEPTSSSTENASFVQSAAQPSSELAESSGVAREEEPQSSCIKEHNACEIKPIEPTTATRGTDPPAEPVPQEENGEEEDADLLLAALLDSKVEPSLQSTSQSSAAIKESRLPKLQQPKPSSKTSSIPTPAAPWASPPLSRQRAKDPIVVAKKTPPVGRTMISPTSRLLRPTTASTEAGSGGKFHNRNNNKRSPPTSSFQGRLQQRQEQAKAQLASINTRASPAGQRLSPEEGQARARARIRSHAMKQKSEASPIKEGSKTAVSNTRTMDSKENDPNGGRHLPQSKLEPRKVSNATLLSQQRRRQKLEHPTGSSSLDSVKNEKSGPMQANQNSTSRQRRTHTAGSEQASILPTMASNSKTPRRIPLTERYLHMQQSKVSKSPASSESPASTSCAVHRRKYGTEFVPTKPQSPKFATSKRPRAALSTLSSSAATDNVVNKSKLVAPRQRGPTVPVGPKFMLESKYGSKLIPNQHEDNKDESSAAVKRKSSATAGSSRRRTTTIPVGPKFALDAKYGVKTSVPSGRDHRVDDDAATTMTRETKRGGASVSGSSTQQKRSVTIPIGPKFMLDAKYGEKKTTPTISADNHEDGATVRSGMSFNTLRSSNQPRGLTVAVGPKFMLDAKYGSKQSVPIIHRDHNADDNDANTVSSTPSAVSALTRNTVTHHQPRTLTVPVGPKFMLDAKYGSKTKRQNDAEMENRRSLKPPSTTRSSMQRRTVTVPVGPKLLLDAKYGSSLQQPHHHRPMATTAL